MAKISWICSPSPYRMGREILPDIQTNARRKRFLGTKRLVESAERSDHPAAAMANKRRLGAFGPPSTMEGGPRRTRRLRHGLSTEHGTPVFQYLRKLGSREILPPDVLRRSESSRRQTAEGGGYLLPCCRLRTLCDCQRRNFLASFLVLVELTVMKTVFIVNEKINFFAGKFSRGPIYRFSSKRQSHITVQAREGMERNVNAPKISAPCFRPLRF